MLTLITGAPGTGKTAYAVDILTKHEFYPDDAVVVHVRDWAGGGRYYESWGPDVRPELEKPRTVFLIDEAQTIWPSRVAGKPKPEICEHLAKHRHVGQDWILTAQHPLQLDVEIRRLVGRHIHLERVALGVKFSESGQCREDLAFQRGESRKYDFPVEALKLYRSEEVRTSLQKKGLRFPRKLMWLGVLIVGMGGLMGYEWHKGGLFHEFDRAAVRVPGGSKQASDPPAAGPLIGGGQGRRGDSGMAELASAPSAQYFFPRQVAYPEVAKAPRLLVACIESGKKCQCWDQAAQRVEGVPYGRCDAIVHGDNVLATLYPDPTGNRPASRWIDPNAEEERAKENWMPGLRPSAVPVQEAALAGPGATSTRP